MRDFHDIRTVRHIKRLGSCAHPTGVGQICARPETRTPRKITACEPVEIATSCVTGEYLSAQHSSQADKELEVFTHCVSHDLRAPLRAIDGFAGLLLEKLTEQPSRHYLECIRASTVDLNERIDGLLGFSRLAYSELRRERVDLTSIAQSIAEELHKREPDRAVEVLVTPRLIVEADAHLVRVMLDNLFENAWKYTGKHPTARIEVGVTERDGQAVFFVRDDGAGFDMTYSDKLFCPFQRLHSPSEFEGSGIGLAIVQRIVHRHGGRVWAEGEVEHGATFFFTLGAS